MRYIPHTSEEIGEMLETIGLKSIDALFRSIPQNLRETENLNLPEGLDEMSLLAHLHQLAGKNETPPQNKSFLGGGVYRHFIPSVVGSLVSRSEFLTPYTPYQPEMAQGTLQTIYEFQTMVAEMYGMEVANASLYDGSTALAEAVLMALRLGKKRKNVLLPLQLHPEYRETVQTTLQTFNDQLIPLPLSPSGGIDISALGDYLNDELACIVLPYPDFFGIVEDLREIVERVHKSGALVIFCVTEPLALGLFESPGALGADIVCGEGQSMGITPSFGGPHVGLFACRKKDIRQMPGRLCGMTTDTQGRRGFVLTLATREQHIRREKATSNICTNQALCATQFVIYLSMLGKIGFQKLALLNWQQAEYAKVKLTATAPVKETYPGKTTFNEFVLTLPRPADTVLENLRRKGFHAGISLSRWYPGWKNEILVNVTECNSKRDIDDLANAFKEVLA